MATTTTTDLSGWYADRLSKKPQASDPERRSCYYCRRTGDPESRESWYAPQVVLNGAPQHVYACRECHLDFLRNGYMIDTCSSCRSVTYVDVHQRHCLDCQLRIEPPPPPPSRRRRRRRGGRGRRKRLALLPCSLCGDPLYVPPGGTDNPVCAACQEVSDYFRHGEQPWEMRDDEEEWGLSAMD